MTVTDAQILDLGQLAVVAESFTGPDGDVAVELMPVDDFQPSPDSRTWTVSRDDVTVVMVELGGPAAEMIDSLLAHLGGELGAEPASCDGATVAPPAAASVVGIRDADGNGLVAYLAPEGESQPAFEGDEKRQDADYDGLLSLGMLRDVPLEVSAELGRTRLSVAEILQLKVGSVVELDRAAGSPVDVVVNGSLIARGEVVVIDDEYGVRITEILGRIGDSL